jgi:DNA (cytosine-5)-methyltransferase 1
MGFDHIEKQFKDPKEIFSVSDSQAFRQLGNAVVPGVVEAVGREVLRTLENN